MFLDLIAGACPNLINIAPVIREIKRRTGNGTLPSATVLSTPPKG